MLAPLLRTIPRAARHVQSPIGARNFQTSSFMMARKSAQDRESMDRSSIEYTRSGTDNSVADGEEAFDPSTTRPEQELKQAAKDNEGEGKSSPLEYSPANPEMSKQSEAAEGGPRTSGEQDHQKQSGAGGGAKGKKIQ